MFSPLQQYEGAMVAPLIPEMQRAQQFLSDYSAGQFDKSSAAAIEEALSGKPSYDVSPEATAEYFGKAVTTPAMRDFSRYVSPQIDEAFAASGTLFGSRRAEAKAQALESLMTGLTAELAKAQIANQTLSAQLAESAKGRQLQAVPLAEQLEQAPLQRSQALSTAAAPFQQQAQNVEAAKYQEWLRTRPEYSPWPQYGLSFLSQPQMMGYGQTGSSAFGTAAGAIGGGLAGAGIGSIVPGIGTAVGGGLGSLAGLLSGLS